LPCIVFYHGFTSSKLVYSYFAVALAEAGFRVIMPDAPEHGARYGAMNGADAALLADSAAKFCRVSGLREAIIGDGLLTTGWRWPAHRWAE
jgi:fermentation-respiration switch protein FrsA (DUF1100 family)